MFAIFLFASPWHWSEKEMCDPTKLVDFDTLSWNHASTHGPMAPWPMSTGANKHCNAEALTKSHVPFLFIWQRWKHWTTWVSFCVCTIFVGFFPPMPYAPIAPYATIFLARKNTMTGKAPSLLWITAKVGRLRLPANSSNMDTCDVFCFHQGLQNITLHCTLSTNFALTNWSDEILCFGLQFM